MFYQRWQIKAHKCKPQKNNMESSRSKLHKVQLVMDGMDAGNALLTQPSVCVFLLHF